MIRKKYTTSINVLHGRALRENRVFDLRLKKNKTYSEIGSSIGISRARVGQIVAKLKQSVSPNTAKHLGEEKTETGYTPQQYQKAHRINQVLVLAVEGFSTKRIAEQLHITPETVREYRKLLQKSIGVETFKKVSSRGRKLRILSAVEEHIRSKHIFPLVQQYFYHFIKKYRLGADLRESVEPLLELESHFMATRLKPHPQPAPDRLVPRRWVYKTVRGIILTQLMMELKQRLGIKQTEARKLQSILGALSKGKPIEEICLERGIPLSEAKELLEIYQHYNQISIEEFQDRI